MQAVLGKSKDLARWLLRTGMFQEKMRLSCKKYSLTSSMAFCFVPKADFDTIVETDKK